MNMNNQNLASAIAFAADKHRDQFRWNGEPYVLHCLRVMAKMTTPLARVVAVLHDTLEDTTATADDLRNRFGGEVTEQVVALTRTGRRLAYNVYIERVSHWATARLVKIADLEDNMDLTQIPGTLDQGTQMVRLVKYHRAWLRLTS